VAPIAISLYEISLSLHIAAVVVGLGSTFALSLTFPVALSLDARHLPYVHRLSLAVNRYLASPGLLLVLVTGVFQVEDGDWDFGDAWISASFAIVIALGGLLGAYFIPSDRRLGAMATREIAAAGAGTIELSDDYQRGARNQGIAGGIAGVLVIAAIVLMVVKPGV
jgi:uncharacterized membrane protein